MDTAVYVNVKKEELHQHGVEPEDPLIPVRKIYCLLHHFSLTLLCLEAIYDELEEAMAVIADARWCQ